VLGLEVNGDSLIFLAAEIVDVGILANLEQPGPAITPLAIGMEIPARLQKSFLDEIL
jgi:hypothetical protein